LPQLLVVVDERSDRQVVPERVDQDVGATESSARASNASNARSSRRSAVIASAHPPAAMISSAIA